MVSLFERNVRCSCGIRGSLALRTLVLVAALAAACQSSGKLDKDIATDSVADVLDSAGAADVPNVGDALPDVELPPADVAMQANLFLNNPAKDDWKTSTVVLTNLDDPEGKLAGPFANVLNCANEEGGWFREYELPLVGTTIVRLCNIKKDVVPDPDGSYLSVEVPKDPLDPGDPFAELMTFFHMNVIHDYFKGTHGCESMDLPLEAYVNLMAYIEMETPFPGVPQGWVSMDNAMYMPKESFDAFEWLGEDLLKEYLGIEDDLDIPFKNDALVFLQGPSVDFAHDADVIYHEYTHAVVGGDRVWGYAVDEHGLMADPFAINEAYADYFACSIAGDPHSSEYALGILKNNEVGRDISIPRICPDNYVGEEHVDGLIYSSALWELHETIGKEATDAIAYNALLSFDLLTTFQEAAEATVAEAALLDPPRDAEVKAVFEKHGLLDCKGRVRPWKDTKPDAPPEYVAGVQSTAYDQFSQGAPGVLQHEIDVPEGTGNIHLEVLAYFASDYGMILSMLGMAGDIQLAVALRRSQPVSYQFDPEYAQTADMIIPMVKKGEGWLAVDISGNCLEPGKLYLQFINASVDIVALDETLLTLSPDLAAKPTFDCKAPDPCEGAPCQATCAIDEDCQPGEQCVPYAEGCCTACLPACGVCYLESGTLCSPAEAPPCGQGIIDLSEIFMCAFSLTLTQSGLPASSAPLVSGCKEFEVTPEGSLCNVFLGTEPGKLTVQCPECDAVDYTPEACTK